MSERERDKVFARIDFLLDEASRLTRRAEDLMQSLNQPICPKCGSNNNHAEFERMFVCDECGVGWGDDNGWEATD